MSDTMEAIAEAVIQNSLEADIEDAQDAGDDAEAQRLYRIQQGVEDGLETVPEAPDADALADDISPSDIEDMGGTRLADYKPYETLSEDERGEEFDRVFSLADTDVSVGILRAEWPGADFDRNLAFGEAALAAIPGSLDVLRVLEVVGLADHPDLIRWLVSAGRLMAGKPGDPNSIPTTTGTQAMDTTIGTNVQAQIDALETEMDRAEAEGDPHKRQELFTRQQGLYRLLPGGRDPIVGGSGRVL